MGPQHKLLLPWRDGEPIVRHVAEAALAAHPLEVVVVVRPDLFALAGALAGLPVRLAGNPAWEEGMGTSLAAGIAALEPEAQAALVLLGNSADLAPAIPPRWSRLSRHGFAAGDPFLRRRAGAAHAVPAGALP